MQLPIHHQLQRLVTNSRNSLVDITQVLSNVAITTNYMKCALCGDSKDYDMLFRCPYCNGAFCASHIPPQAHQCPGNNASVQYRVQFPPQNPFVAPDEEMYERALRQNPDVLTTGKESLDLLIGFLLLSFALTFYQLAAGTMSLSEALVLSIVIGPSFIFHEMGHKYAAIHYGKYSRFTMIKRFALFTLFFAFMPVGIAAPGATVTMGRASKSEVGKFAIAGPLVNLVLGTLSLLLIFMLPPLQGILVFSATINVWLGLFNLIPVAVLDGKKIIAWSKYAWGGTVALFLVLAYAITFF